jgi:fructokinase
VRGAPAGLAAIDPNLGARAERPRDFSTHVKTVILTSGKLTSGDGRAGGLDQLITAVAPSCAGFGGGVMFLVCGEALWDLFATEVDGRLSFDARIGGSPFNVAVGLARLGQRAALFTGMSTDRLGQRLRLALESEGVGTHLLVATDRPTTLSIVDVGSNGVPVYAFYGEGAADREIRPSDLPTLGPDVWGIHAGSYSLVAEPVGTGLFGFLEREAGRRLISLDPNVRLNVEADKTLWRERIERLMRFVDLVKVSDEDLGLLYPGATAREIAERWLAAGVGVVFVTRGPSGAEAYSAAGRVAVASQQVLVADTVGAGDTFQAALIAALAERGVWGRSELDRLGADDIVAVAEFASAAAAITCARHGADLPRRGDLPFHAAKSI